MPEPLVGVTLDCSDLDRAERFWRDALDYEPRPGFGDETFRTLFAPDGRPGLHHLTLQRVPEAKTTKARAHLDLFFRDIDNHVARLVGLGATILLDRRLEDPNVIMQDPDGNEFCVVGLPE